MFSHKLDYSFIAVFVNYLSFNSLSKLKFWIVPPPEKKKKMSGYGLDPAQYYPVAFSEI